LHDLRELAKQRGYDIVCEYTDQKSGSKSKRPGLDKLMADARRNRFDEALVWAFDRTARSVRHFLEILDELNHLGIEFVSFLERMDTRGPLGRAMVVIVGAIAELEKNLIVERVRAGMRRATLEGRQIVQAPLNIDRQQIVRDRCLGMSLTQVARKYRISRATVCRLMKQAASLPAINPSLHGLEVSVLTLTPSPTQQVAIPALSAAFSYKQLAKLGRNPPIISSPGSEEHHGNHATSTAVCWEDSMAANRSPTLRGLVR
jgi:DNA invertase Pin-like site-specific DNA recombinase